MAEPGPADGVEQQQQQPHEAGGAAGDGSRDARTVGEDDGGCNGNDGLVGFDGDDEEKDELFGRYSVVVPAESARPGTGGIAGPEVDTLGDLLDLVLGEEEKQVVGANGLAPPPWVLAQQAAEAAEAEGEAEYDNESEDEADEDGEDNIASVQGALLAACRKGETEKARALAEDLGPEELLETVDDFGNSALHLAAKSGNLLLFQHLANLQPDLLEQENAARHLPLDIASEAGCLAIVLWTHDAERPRVEESYRAREYFACTSCGLCVNQRERFEKVICKKDRDHKWRGERREDLPRHIVSVRAPDFAGAKAAIKAEWNRDPPRPTGWWCKAGAISPPAGAEGAVTTAARG